jgi:hypothetical protein
MDVLLPTFVRLVWESLPTDAVQNPWWLGAAVSTAVVFAITSTSPSRDVDHFLGDRSRRLQVG